MLSGVIFVALALLWALFLIPKALRSHDEAARPRSVESTSDQARVLRRESTESGTTVESVEPAEAVETLEDVESRPTPQPASVPEQRRPAAREVAQRQRRLAAAAARRRRRVLGLLLLATAVVGALAGTEVLLPWAPVVPAGATLGFLVVARVTVHGERRRWDELRARLAAAPAAADETAHDEVRPQAPTEVLSTPSVRPVLVPLARNGQGVAVVSDVEDTSAFSAQALAEAVGASGVPVPSTLWDPLPVTLPTYVGKPRATRSVRTIDLTAPGVSSSGRDAADSALVAESATAMLAEQDAPGRRAVGG